MPRCDNRQTSFNGSTLFLQSLMDPSPTAWPTYEGQLGVGGHADVGSIGAPADVGASRGAQQRPHHMRTMPIGIRKVAKGSIIPAGPGRVSALGMPVETLRTDYSIRTRSPMHTTQNALSGKARGVSALQAALGTDAPAAHRILRCVSLSNTCTPPWVVTCASQSTDGS